MSHQPAQVWALSHASCTLPPHAPCSLPAAPRAVHPATTLRAAPGAGAGSGSTVKHAWSAAQESSCCGAHDPPSHTCATSQPCSSCHPRRKGHVYCLVAPIARVSCHALLQLSRGRMTSVLWSMTTPGTAMPRTARRRTRRTERVAAAPSQAGADACCRQLAELLIVPKARRLAGACELAGADLVACCPAPATGRCAQTLSADGGARIAD